jgi:hypothetical protein
MPLLSVRNLVKEFTRSSGLAAAHLVWCAPWTMFRST